MQTLRLAEDVFNELLMDKRCTIRKGRKDIYLDLVKFESTEEKREIYGNVTTVIYTTLENIPEEHVLNDGFLDHKDMFEQMKRFYPDIVPTDDVTVVVFEVNQDQYWNQEQARLVQSIKK